MKLFDKYDNWVNLLKDTDVFTATMSGSDMDPLELAVAKTDDPFVQIQVKEANAKNF